MASTLIELQCDALPEGFRAIGVRGDEAMNSLSRWEVRGVCEEAITDLDKIVGSKAGIRVVDELEGTARPVGVVVTDVAHDGEDKDGHRYTVTLAPQEWALTLRSGYRIFLEKSTKQIVEELLKDAGIPSDQVVWRLSGSYGTRLTCVQYGETAWDFMTRILADEGISLWFDAADDGKPLLIFGDAPTAHDGLRENRVVPFEDAGNKIAYRRFMELERVDSMVTTSVHVRDYDVRAPDVLIEGNAGEGPLEHYEYPACVLTSDAAKTRAAARLDQLQRFQTKVIARSDCIRLQPGRVVKIERCADEWMNGDHLVVAVRQGVTSGAQNSNTEGAAFLSEVTLVPHKPRAFRPDVPKRLPKVEGLEPAFTTGPSGQEIHVDDLGRVKVRFPWDRSGLMDDTSSWWVRCLQMGMGGSMVLPRVGWEVPVVYVDGNPDLPFVLGRLYNATAIVPYGLPGAAATTTLQSATSPGGGSTNEIRMGDSAGKQEMFIHASKDQTVVVGGSATSDVSANETHDITLTLKSTINGSQSLTVGATQDVNVGTDYAISVGGARSETIGGMESIKVTANRNVTCASYTELIGALYGVQCNQSLASVKGTFLQLIGGSMNLAGGLGVSETVVAARTELVSGAKSLVSAGAASDGTTGIHAVTSGATTEKAGANVVTQTKVAGSIKVGGSANMKSGGDFAIEAPTISIEAASLSAKALELKGGALSAKKGTTKVKASAIKRQGGGWLG